MIFFKKVFLMLVVASSIAFGATTNNSTNKLNAQSLTNAKKTVTGSFASGSILDGSTKAGNVARWYLFNEGHVGYSYSKLGDLNLHSADLGYSLYITSIKAASNVRPYIGTEITVPLYLKSTGDSNGFDPAVSNVLGTSGLPGGNAVKTDVGFNGWGIQIPVILGVQVNSYYIQGMIGYGYHSITDTFYVSDTMNDVSVDNIYQGLVYGLGAGIKFSNVFSFGVRYIMGDLTNTSREPSAGIITNALRSKDFKNNYQRFSVIFGIVF